MMGTTTKRSSDREKWDKVFDGLVKLLKNQQEQLETLAKERKILEDRIKMQQERWISDIRLYEDHIFQASSAFSWEISVLCGIFKVRVFLRMFEFFFLEF